MPTVNALDRKAEATERLLTNTITLKRRISVKSDEPITHIHELQGIHQHGKILFCTLNGIIYLLDNIRKKVILKLNVNAQNHRPPDPLISAKPIPNTNCIYFMAPYSQFDAEQNPLLVVHD